jgi:hypothetical protein
MNTELLLEVAVNNSHFRKRFFVHVHVQFVGNKAICVHPFQADVQNLTLLLHYKYQLMLYSEIVAVCSQIHTNTLCEQNVEFVNVKPGLHIRRTQ